MQIGQIMLTMPNAMAKMGLIPAIPLAIFIACMSLWSMKMLICLYVARRSILVWCYSLHCSAQAQALLPPVRRSACGNFCAEHKTRVVEHGFVSRLLLGDSVCRAGVQEDSCRQANACRQCA